VGEWVGAWTSSSSASYKYLDVPLTTRKLRFGSVSWCVRRPNICTGPAGSGRVVWALVFWPDYLLFTDPTIVFPDPSVDTRVLWSAQVLTSCSCSWIFQRFKFKKIGKFWLLELFPDRTKRYHDICQNITRNSGAGRVCPLYGTDAQFDPHMYFIVAGIVPFDKIPSPFQIIIVCFIQKTEYNVRAGRATGMGIEPATSRQRPCCPTTVPKNTGCCIDGDFEFWAIKCLNFVLKAGILQPVTSPSIFWTILFVCTRS